MTTPVQSRKFAALRRCSAVCLSLVLVVGGTGAALAQQTGTPLPPAAPVPPPAPPMQGEPVPSVPPIPPIPQDPSVPPVPPTPPMPSEPAAHVEGNVTFTSSPSNSIVGDYQIDFASMDANGDGSISRSEARANATLTAEFIAVDIDNNGRLSQDELKGWM